VRLLLDTQILVWLVIGDRRLDPAKRAAIFDADNELMVSSVIAFEYTDLRLRGRFPVDEPLAELERRFGLEVVGYPVNAWQQAENLLPIHRDPVDRMLIAHAISDGMTIVTSDRNIHRYPVNCI
jgi:PIN domain nuclease of toxin-antitoxin system